MNIEVQKRWVEALRSGEYEQDVEFLRTSDGWCCLGVLCDLHNKEFNADPKFNTIDIFGIPEGGYLGNTTMPPESVLDWGGVTKNTAIWLVTLNDNGVPFEDIAKTIETMGATTETV